MPWWNMIFHGGILNSVVGNDKPQRQIKFHGGKWWGLPPCTPATTPIHNRRRPLPAFTNAGGSICSLSATDSSLLNSTMPTSILGSDSVCITVMILGASSSPEILHVLYIYIYICIYECMCVHTYISAIVPLARRAWFELRLPAGSPPAGWIPVRTFPFSFWISTLRLEILPEMRLHGSETLTNSKEN